MRKEYYIYFMTNKSNRVLYTGVTNNLLRRVIEHKAKINKWFTEKYNCNKLVYYEVGNSIIDAIAREKQIKNWKREWKNNLVNNFNKDWRDLSYDIWVTDGLVLEIAEQVRNDRVPSWTCPCHPELVSGSQQEIMEQVRNDKAQVRNDKMQVCNDK